MGCGSRAWLALMRRGLSEEVLGQHGKGIKGGGVSVIVAGFAFHSLTERNCGTHYFHSDFCSQMLEMALPLLFVYIIVAIKASLGSSNDKVVDAYFPETAITPLSFSDYVTAMRAQRVCVKGSSGSSDLEVSGIMDNGYNWLVPLVKCQSSKCEYEGQSALEFCEFSILAVAGSDAGGTERATAFKDWVLTTYPEISEAEKKMPFKFELVQTFDSPSVMNDYVKSHDYGTTAYPKIAMGVVWEGNDASHYNYQLRQNSTNFNAPENEAQPATQTTPSTGSIVDSFTRKDDGSCSPANGSPRQGPFESSCTGQYLYNGVLTFQRLVNDFILESSGAAVAGYTVAEAGVQFVSFPSRPYVSSGFFSTISGMI